MTTEPLARDYRYGRDRYHLTASLAHAYARDLATVRASTLDWYAEPDPDADPDRPPALTVYIFDPDLSGPFATEPYADTVAALGGVELEYTVSDHGNTHYDETDPYLVATVAGMMREANR